MNWDIPAMPPTFVLLSYGNRIDEEKKFNFTPHLFEFAVPYFGHDFLFNETINYTDYDFSCSSNQNSFSNLISMILYAIVCVVGLFGNTLVIYVVLRFSNMQTVTNMYIVNLAIADECYLIGIPFLLITMHLGHWSFGETMCKAYMVSTSITQFTSSIFLLIMSADRYIAICHPISSQRIRTPLISKIVSIIAWLTSAIIMLPVILFSNTIEYEYQRYSCIIKWPENHGTESGTTFTLYALILGFAIPLSFILFFYCLVLKKLHSRNTSINSNKTNKFQKRSHRKVTKLVLTVITVYILCWLPHWISQVALIHSSPHKCRSKLEITIFLLVGCLGYSNSAMNPILYAFLSENFKKSFMKAFSCELDNFNGPKEYTVNNSRHLIQMDVKNCYGFMTRFSNKNKNHKLSQSGGSSCSNRKQIPLSQQGNENKNNLTTISRTGDDSMDNLEQNQQITNIQMTTTCTMIDNKLNNSIQNNHSVANTIVVIDKNDMINGDLLKNNNKAQQKLSNENYAQQENHLENNIICRLEVLHTDL